jgi:hypothetical protein
MHRKPITDSFLAVTALLPPPKAPPTSNIRRPSTINLPRRMHPLRLRNHGVPTRTSRRPISGSHIVAWGCGWTGRGMAVGRLFAGIEIIFGVVCYFSLGVKLVSASSIRPICGMRGSSLGRYTALISRSPGSYSHVLSSRIYRHSHPEWKNSYITKDIETLYIVRKIRIIMLIKLGDLNLRACTVSQQLKAPPINSCIKTTRHWASAVVDRASSVARRSVYNRNIWLSCINDVGAVCCAGSTGYGICDKKGRVGAKEVEAEIAGDVWSVRNNALC